MASELIAINLIDPNPWQPRTSEDAEHIANLAVSIADDGLMQIPSARKAGERYQLAFGHSRLAAFKLLSDLQKSISQGDPILFEADTPMGKALAAAETALDNLTDFEAMPLNVMEIDDESIFRFAVSENLQRKDLNAVETAQAMRRYKDEFGKTSAEIGALFGVNDATVRGTLRLLDLPTEVQDLLATGDISQNAARALLSAQKVISKARVIEAARNISEEAGKRTPESVVIDALRWKDGVEVLCEDDAEGRKPRGGRNGWLLDMKNFPNRLLVPLTKGELPQLLGIKETDNTLFWKYLTQAEDIDDLRLKLWAAEGEGERALAGKIDMLVNPTVCTTCPYYTKVRGVHFCGLRACYFRKREAWEQEAIDRASDQVKIARYTEADGPYEPIECYREGNMALFETRNPDLRLIERNKVKGYPSQYNFKGIDMEIFCVVLVGEELQKMKAAKKAARTLEKAGLRSTTTRYDLLTDKRERLVWEAAGYCASVFQPFGAEVVAALDKSSYNWGESGPGWAQPKEKTPWDERAEFTRRKLALNILKKLIPTNVFYQSTITDLASETYSAAVKMGVELPASVLQMAREADEEIENRYPVPDRESAPVSMETTAVDVEAE